MEKKRWNGFSHWAVRNSFVLVFITTTTAYGEARTRRNHHNHHQHTTTSTTIHSCIILSVLHVIFKSYLLIRHPTSIQFFFRRINAIATIGGLSFCYIFVGLFVLAGSLTVFLFVVVYYSISRNIAFDAEEPRLMCISNDRRREETANVVISAPGDVHTTTLQNRAPAPDARWERTRYIDRRRYRPSKTVQHKTKWKQKYWFMEILAHRCNKTVPRIFSAWALESCCFYL